jgi:hypothetical protein
VKKRKIAVIIAFATILTATRLLTTNHKTFADSVTTSQTSTKSII